MRAVFPLIALTLATGAAAEAPEALPPSTTVRIAPSAGADVLAPGERAGRVPCRDTIHQVREARGLPDLDRGTATPDEGMLIAAVDHRIDGCSVMVMYNDTSDIRPLPAMPDGAPTLRRIPGR